MARRPSSVCLSVRPSVNFCANRFFSHTNGRIATKLSQDGLQVCVHPGCAQGQGQGQRSRDTSTFFDSWNELLRHWRSDIIIRYSPVGRFRSLDRRSETRSLTSSEIRRVVQTVLRSFLRQSCLVVITKCDQRIRGFLECYALYKSTFYITLLYLLSSRVSYQKQIVGVSDQSRQTCQRRFVAQLISVCWSTWTSCTGISSTWRGSSTCWTCASPSRVDWRRRLLVVSDAEQRW